MDHWLLLIGEFDFMFLCISLRIYWGGEHPQTADLVHHR